MPLYIEDEATTQLVNQLAKLLGTTEQDAVRLAVAAAIKRTTEAVPLRD